MRLQTAASPVAKLVLDLVTPPGKGMQRQHRTLYQHSFRAAIEQGLDAESEIDDVTESRPVRLAVTDRACFVLEQQRLAALQTDCRVRLRSSGCSSLISDETQQQLTLPRQIRDRTE